MKLQESLVRKIVIKDVPHLDPINVFIEDFEEGQGNITISCYGKSWSHYWGSMGCDLISFIEKANVSYIVGKLDSMSNTVTDIDKLLIDAKKTLLQRRRDGEIEYDDIRDLWDNIKYMWDGEELLQDTDLMYKIYGDEWWCGLPTKPNPDYEYLRKVVSTVKEGLLLCDKQKELA